MQPPCFDIKTQTDCPNRAAGCNVTCTAWAEYEKYKVAKYEAQAIERAQQEVSYRYKESVEKKYRQRQGIK